MIYDIFCPGHFRKFTTAGGRLSYGKDFCGGCTKKPLKTIQQRLEQTVMKLTDLTTRTLTKNRDDAHLSIGRFSRTKLGTYNDISACSAPYYQTAHSEFSNSVMVSLCFAALIVFNIDTLQAVPLDSLRAPMTAMKNEVWSYMYVVKVAAALMGGLMSVVQQNLMPLGIGGGIAAGIHFFDGVIGDGSAALIGF